VTKLQYFMGTLRGSIPDCTRGAAGFNIDGKLDCKPPTLLRGAGRPTARYTATRRFRSPPQNAEMPTEYDHDSSYLHSGLDPKLTPRLRRGPRPICTCDLPGCLYCRRKAAQRRWYLRNRLEILAHAAGRVERESRRVLGTGSLPPQGGLTDSDLDLKCLQLLKQEGYR
jgi:hypothetical protein